MKKFFPLCLLALLPLSAMAGNDSDSLAVHIEDMHCRKCANRIMNQLGEMQGIGTMTPQLARHNMVIHYDASRTSSADIRSAIDQLGYTPVSYYASQNVAYAYFIIPAEAATQDNVISIRSLRSVVDVNANAHRKALAVTYFCNGTTPEQLLADIQRLGIPATVPAPHVCKEESAAKATAE